MFIKAIEKVGEFTRPILTISRLYDDKTVDAGAATLFFVNENGSAVTCKHVAAILVNATKINKNYEDFKKEKESLGKKQYNQRLRALEAKYKLSKEAIVQLKAQLAGCTNDPKPTIKVHLHPKYDLAIIDLRAESYSYKNYATFFKSDDIYLPGKYLCRLGYPFPEFTNFKLSEITDDIEWTKEGNAMIPRFPIEGMLTRLIKLEDKVAAFEMSTPGLKGQSGGPAFDENGIIYGMQYQTNHLHLGFDRKNADTKIGSRTIKVTNQPFLHVGNCLRGDIIKEFLKEKGIKFYEV